MEMECNIRFNISFFYNKMLCVKIEKIIMEYRVTHKNTIYHQFCLYTVDLPFIITIILCWPFLVCPLTIPILTWERKIHLLFKGIMFKNAYWTWTIACQISLKYRGGCLMQLKNLYCGKKIQCFKYTNDNKVFST